MSKRFTKIICLSVAAISAFTLAFTSACSVKWSGVDGGKDASTQAVEGTNGGFVTETADYVYFINGKANNTDANKFGTVLKGSVQRISRQDLNAGNYGNTQTVVPSVIYSGSYDAGLYIYDGYLYYTSPTTEKNTDGEVLNSNLDFKRTKLDGTDTTKTYIWQSSDNAVDYRYVQVDGTVYILYALSENLYGTSATNIHSVNCSTGANTLIAYNVQSYVFDTENAENPYVYYTMNVPYYFGSGSNYSYNQLYRARADVTSSPREYDFGDVKDYDAAKDPVYVNYGEYVFDGIGKLDYESGRVSQLNFAHYNGKLHGTAGAYGIAHAGYSYSLRSYKDGVLYYTRQMNGSSLTSLHTLSDGDIKSDWDAVQANVTATPLISGADTTEYEFITLNGELYAINASASGITRSKVENGVVGDPLTVSTAASATILKIAEKDAANGYDHTYVYYSVSGGNGYTVNRIAVDGTEDDYKKLSTTVKPDPTYRSIKILDLDACSSWYMPEFVSGTHKLMFASETEGMSSYNYIMVCDLEGKDGVMTNAEISDLNEKYTSVTEKIDEYDENKNPDGSVAYDGLTNALKYQFATGDSDYIEELRKAYTDVLGKDKEYAYTDEVVEICKQFAAAEGDWESFKAGDGESYNSNNRNYYYSVIGRMTEADEKGFKDGLRGTYMKEYPVDNSTWWEGLSSGAKAGFIIGMIACGLVVIGGVTVLTVWLVKRKKRAAEEGGQEKPEIDITDDKNVNVYGDDGENGGSQE